MSDFDFFSVEFGLRLHSPNAIFLNSLLYVEGALCTEESKLWAEQNVMMVSTLFLLLVFSINFFDQAEYTLQMCSHLTSFVLVRMN